MTGTAATAANGGRYTGVAQLLHWAMALFIIAAVLLGLFHGALEAMGWRPIALHKSIGITVFVLTLVRIGWRIANPPPPYPATMVGWEKLAAKSAVWIFYGLMLVLPIGGYIFSSAGSRPMMWFGIPLAKLPVAEGSALAEIAHEAHELLGFAMAGLILLHIAAALRHRLVLRDGLFARMLPQRG